MSMPPHTPQEPASGAPAPGWYDDPAAPGRPRWWDGTQWAAPGQQPPAYPPAGPAGPTGPAVPLGRPAVDVESERRSGRAARIALIFGIVAYSLNAVLSVLILEWAVGYFREVFDAIGRGESTAPQPPPMTEVQAVANVATNLTSIATLAAGVLFLIWFYRSAVNARNLGLPSRLSPVWTIFGFIVPVISLWFPCWSARGLFPKDHAGRRLAVRWWLTYLAAGLLTTGSMIGLLYDSFTVAMVIAGVACVLFVISGLLARQLIHEAGELHTAMAVQSGQVAPAMAVPPSAPVDPWAKAAERRDDPWSAP